MAEAGTSKTAKRVALSIDTKLKILTEIEKNALSKGDIAKKYKISPSTLSTILKNKEKILKDKDAGCGKDRKRSCDAKFPELENALVLWIKKCRAKNVVVDGKLLKAKAEDFALQMNIEDFNQSDGWLQRFKKRHGLAFRKLCGESAAVNTASVETWKNETLKDILSKYKPEDVYNADETGLVYKLTPQKSFVFKNESYGGGKKAKDRLSLLLAANMTGSDKLPLFVIGKFKKPRCFKGLHTLPATYKANAKAWMTSEIFVEWVRDLDKQMTRKGRKIVLFVDNCTAHPPIEDLKAIRLEFLPPNTTAVIQPMDQGVIQNLKVKYRRMLLNRIVISLENDKEYEIHLLSAMGIAVEAWKQVTPETIKNSFRHAGFTEDLTSSASEMPAASQANETDATNDVVEGDGLLQTLRDKNLITDDVTFTGFAESDNNLQCTEELTDKEIVEQASKQQDSESSDEESEVRKGPKPTLKQALDGIEVLRDFFNGTECSSKVFQNMEYLENEVFACATTSRKQSRITEFFQVV